MRVNSNWVVGHIHDLRRGGGYTALAIVADVHPLTHPPKTKPNLYRV